MLLENNGPGGEATPQVGLMLSLQNLHCVNIWGKPFTIESQLLHL